MPDILSGFYVSVGKLVKPSDLKSDVSNDIVDSTSTTHI